MIYMLYRYSGQKQNLRKFAVEENHKSVSGSKFERATLIGVPTRKLNSSNCKLTDSTTGVAPNTYSEPIK